MTPDQFKDRHEAAAGGQGGGAPNGGAQPAPAPAPAPEPEPEPEPAPMELSEEEAAQKDKQDRALEAKARGNAAYKKKQFAEAIGCYDEALALWDGDISFLTNRAAVYMETGEYEKAVADCDAAVDKGRELRADYKAVARALT